MRPDKTLERVLSGQHDAALPFTDLVRLLEALSFELRIKGNHHIFTRDGLPEILNLQPKGGRAKPYQVRQVRRVILLRKLELK